MKKKQILAAIMAVAMASSLAVTSPRTSYAADSGTGDQVAEEQTDVVRSDSTSAEDETISEMQNNTESEETAEADSQELQTDIVPEGTDEESDIAAESADQNAVSATQSYFGADEKGTGDDALMRAIAGASAGTQSADEEKTYGNYKYKINSDSNSVTITKYTGQEENVTIPAEIDGRPVIEIGEGSFSNCKSLSTVQFPDSLETIDTYAFADCDNLQDVQLPEGLKTIGYGAFTSPLITSITIPSTVEELGWLHWGALPKSSFLMCPNLETVVFADGTTSIPRYALSECENVKDIIIPESVTEIGDAAFLSCGSLKKINLPKGLKEIRVSTFGHCVSLQTVQFPDSLETIDDYAFQGCDSLETVSLFSRVKHIGKKAFCWCTNLRSIQIPQSVTSIEESSFDDCNKKLLTIYGYNNSYAERYAKEQGLAFVSISDDDINYQADYTQIFQKFMTDRGTFGAIKMMVKNENWPAFDYVYENDQKIGTYITAAISNILFRYKNLEGGRDLVSGEISQKYAKEVLLALMDQKQSEVESLVKAREAQNMAQKISDNFDKFIKKTSGLAISPEDRAHLENFFHSETIDKKLEEGKYSDLINMCHLNGYKNSSAVVQTLKLYQESSEFSKIISDTLGITGKTLNLAENANDFMQLTYQYRVTTETNRVYIELLTYIRDNAKFAAVSDAAAEIVDILNTNANDQWKKIAAVYASEKGEDYVISKLTGLLKETITEAIKGTEWGLTLKAFEQGVDISNKVFGTANYQEKYDNMRVLAYLGDAVGQWTISNYNAYFQTSDTAKKNDCARKAYYGLKMLLKTRQNGEEALQGLWIGKGEKNFKESWYYQTSVGRSMLLNMYEKNLFTTDMERVFHATAVSCPVDVEVYNASGTKVLTIKNGQEIPITTSGDIFYTEYLNPGSGEYDKIVLLPQNAGYSLKCVGTGLGTMNLHTMDMSNEAIIDKNLQNVPITPNTTVLVADPSGRNGTITLITGNGSAKTTMQMESEASAYVPVKNLKVTSDKLQLKEGEQILITVKAEPASATDQSIKWSTESDKIATVSSDGVVTGKRVGQTTLTASAENGTITRKLMVTVLKKGDSGSSDNNSDKPKPIDTPFTDINAKDWYYSAVQWAVENNITAGTSATTFSPYHPCTRAQVVTFLWRLAGRPEPSSSENPFKDVGKNAWYYKAVLWAFENQVTNGTTSSTFSPDDPCTRAQIVTFLWNYSGKPNLQANGRPFTDVKEGSWYAKAVSWAVAKKIAVGTSANTFSPDETSNRAQSVTFIYRMAGNH